MLKLDFKNAFNSLRRDKMLQSVIKFSPAFFRFVQSAYEKPSCLFCGDHILQSAEGVQQGDPMGPLLFCISIHDLVSKLQSELVVFYLDDGTIGGSFQDVLADLRLVELKASKLGLELNHSKSELICNQPLIQDAMLVEVPSFHSVSCSNATLLGSPIGDVDCVDEVIMRKIELLQLMGERLNLLCSHDALTLLRHSFAIPRLLFTLRTAPCFLSGQLKSFDDILRSTLSNIVNINLDSESAWLQASLPVKAGGIGIRRATLASAAGCSSIVRQILPLPFIECADACTKAALVVWGEDHSHPPPPSPSSCHQKSWDAPKIKATVDHLLESAANDLTKVRFLALSCPESGAWLNALPLSSIGLRMDDDVIRIAVGLRLGLAVCHPHACSDCGAEVNEDGIHGLSCRYSRGRHSRHSALIDIVKRSLEAAKVPVTWSHLACIDLMVSVPMELQWFPGRGGKY